MTKMQLITTKHFNGCALDCYVEPAQTDKSDFWASREQIGLLLEYEEPRISIANIHNRHSERLDKFSRVINLITEAGNREATVYNFKGLLEICRYSNQPKANAVMDWLWDVADEIRRTGNYSTGARRAQCSFKFFKTAELLLDKAVRCKTEADRQSVLGLDRLCQDAYGCSVLEVAGIELGTQPEAQPQPEPKSSNRSAEIWEHIVSTFAPDEWFTAGELRQSLDELPVGSRQVRRYLLSFVANKQLKRRGSYKGTEYSIRRS